MGEGRKIEIEREGDGISVRDYGRGIPLGKLVECVSRINTGGKSAAGGVDITWVLEPSPEDPAHTAYPPSRAHHQVEAILGDFEGTLVADGYDAYDRFEDKRKEVVHALCWVHTRRMLVKAEDVEPQRVKKALEMIRALYEVEQEIRDRKLTGEAKLALRAKRSKPIVAEFFAWLKQELIHHALLPTNLTQRRISSTAPGSSPGSAKLLPLPAVLPEAEQGSADRVARGLVARRKGRLT